MSLMICVFHCHCLLTIWNFTPFINLMYHTMICKLQSIDWASLWQLQIAIPKCTTFRISNQQLEISEEISDKSYNIDGCILPFGSCVRDLGIHHDSRLKYDQHVSVIVHSAYKRASLIMKSFHSHDPKILKHAFCVCVRPLLEFSTQIWSPHYKYLIDEVESVQRIFH